MFLLGVTLLGQDLHLRYTLPAPSNVEEVSGTVYRKVGGRQLQFDLYRPAAAERSPVVVFLNGIAVDELKRWPIYRDWGRVVTWRGLAGITMDLRVASVAEDFRALLDYLHSHAAALRLDPENVLLWACLANVTAGLPVAMDSHNQELRGAVIYYGSGEVKDLRLDVPVLYVRVGTDDANQNRQIDATLSRALALNAPFTLVNLPATRHTPRVRYAR